MPRESPADRGGEVFLRTNRQNQGLISVDRSNKATLLLTIPRSFQVVYKGFILPDLVGCDSETRAAPFLGPRYFSLYDSWARALRSSSRTGEGRHRRVLAGILA